MFNMRRNQPFMAPEDRQAPMQGQYAPQGMMMQPQPQPAPPSTAPQGMMPLRPEPNGARADVEQALLRKFTQNRGGGSFGGLF